LLTLILARRSGGHKRREEGKALHSRWVPQPQGVAKVNVDAAVMKLSAKGAVCRSFDGTFLGQTATVYDGLTYLGPLEVVARGEPLDVAKDLLLGPVCEASGYFEDVQGLHWSMEQSFRDQD
jgi:hypothetical protein